MKRNPGIAILLLAAIPIAVLAINPPGDLVAIGTTSNRILLTWLDKSTNEIGFTIERSSAPGTNSFTDPTHIVAAGITEWNDATVVPKQTTYTYRVYAYSATETSDYSNVASATAPGSPYDPWDSVDATGPGGATLVAPNFAEQTHRPHSLTAIDIYDWFKVYLVSGSTYNFNTVGGLGNHFAELYTDSAGFFRVAFDDDSGGGGRFSLTYTATTTAWHYLRVRTDIVGEIAYYDLNYSEVIAGNIDAWDPGDDSSTSATVADITNAIEWTHGPHSLSDVDAADWFRVPLSNGTAYVITTSEGYGDTYGELYSDPNGVNMVASDDDSGQGSQFRVAYTPSTTTSFWIKVTTYTNSITNASYYLRLSREHDAWDLGDGTSGGASILAAPTSTVQQHGPHRVSAFIPDTVDWFRVALDAGVAYQFNSIGGNGDPRIQLRNLGGTILATDDDSGGDGQFNLIFSNSWGSADYYLAVQANTGTADYVLGYSRGDDTWDPTDDTKPAATALSEPPIGETNHGPHVLSATDLSDWFSFPLIEGKKYYFEAVNANGDTVGELYDSVGEQAAIDDDSGEGTQFSIIYTPTNSTNYYVWVRTHGTGEVASYSLSYSRSIDGDEDRIPDDWEVDRLGSVTNSNGGTDDYDGDAATDYNEYIADTDPADSNTWFDVASITELSGTNQVLRWNSSSNRTYDVEHATFLQGFEPLETNIAALPPMNVYTAASSDSLYFYRLKVRNLIP